jgi:hypothetical protein
MLNLDKKLNKLNVDTITLCENCLYLKECRACFRCTHPNGLKEPKPMLGTFCCYGMEREATNEVKTN